MSIQAIQVEVPPNVGDKGAGANVSTVAGPGRYFMIVTNPGEKYDLQIAAIDVDANYMSLAGEFTVPATGPSAGVFKLSASFAVPYIRLKKTGSAAGSVTPSAYLCGDPSPA